MVYVSILQHKRSKNISTIPLEHKYLPDEYRLNACLILRVVPHALLLMCKLMVSLFFKETFCPWHFHNCFVSVLLHSWRTMCQNWGSIDRLPSCKHFKVSTRISWLFCVQIQCWLELLTLQIISPTLPWIGIMHFLFSNKNELDKAVIQIKSNYKQNDSYLIIKISAI